MQKQAPAAILPAACMWRTAILDGAKNDQRNSRLSLGIPSIPGKARNTDGKYQQDSQ
jgi:hypothetical protein